MIIDGKQIANKKLRELKIKVQGLTTKLKLVAILVGNDPASEMYVSMKAKKAAEVGIEFEVIRDVHLIPELNRDDSVAGIIVQLPLPKEMNTDEILQTIDPKKDVDGLTRNSQFLPATVKAVLTAIRAVSGEQIADRTYTIVGQGRLVGKPLSDYLEKQGVKVIRCDEFTKDLKAETLKGDVLVSATGVPGLIKLDMVKPGAVVVDCGAPKPEVDPAVFEIASAMTPVPGGIGPLTVACLLENTIEAYVN